MTDGAALRLCCDGPQRQKAPLVCAAMVPNKRLCACARSRCPKRWTAILICEIREDSLVIGESPAPLSTWPPGQSPASSGTGPPGTRPPGTGPLGTEPPSTGPPGRASPRRDVLAPARIPAPSQVQLESAGKGNFPVASEARLLAEANSWQRHVSGVRIPAHEERGLLTESTSSRAQLSSPSHPSEWRLTEPDNSQANVSSRSISVASGRTTP